MKKYYYLVTSTVNYIDIDFLPKSDKKQVTYAFEQPSEGEYDDFFLGLAGRLKREIRQSFLESNTLIKESKIISVDIKSISKLN